MLKRESKLTEIESANCISIVNSTDSSVYISYQLQPSTIKLGVSINYSINYQISEVRATHKGYSIHSPM